MMKIKEENSVALFIVERKAVKKAILVRISKRTYSIAIPQYHYPWWYELVLIPSDGKVCKGSRGSMRSILGTARRLQEDEDAKNEKGD